MTKAHLISAHKTNILNLGEPLKTQGRALKICLWLGPSNKRSSIQGSSNTPLTKDLNWEELSWDDQSAATRIRRESSNRRHDGTYRRASPIIFVSPTVGQGVNPATAEGGKFRIEPLNLGVKMRRKPIDCVRAPFGVNHSKYRSIEGPVIFVNKFTEKICPIIKRPWDPLHFQSDAV